MIEAWAVLGRCATDKKFFRKSRRRIETDGEIVILTGVRRWFEKNGLRLSRWEVNEAHRLLSTSGVRKGLKKLQKHARKIPGMSDITGRDGFKKDLEFYSVIGLACIDKCFRSDLYKAAKRSNLEDLIKFLKDFDPKFSCNPDLLHFGVLRCFIRKKGVKGNLKKVEKAGWKSPGKRFSCAIGYSEAKYLHVNQPQFEKAMKDWPLVELLLLWVGAISPARI